jgi:hypothetical protein
MSVFGSKLPLRIFSGHFFGCKSMDFFHALGSAVLTVADVACGLLVLVCFDVNGILECAFCDGRV